MTHTIGNEIRRLLDDIHPELLPLTVEQNPHSDRLGGEWFVCDRNGLEFAASRERDRETAELIAYLINNAAALAEGGEP
jgi:hypothetical protein